MYGKGGLGLACFLNKLVPAPFLFCHGKAEPSKPQTPARQAVRRLRAETFGADLSIKLALSVMLALFIMFFTFTKALAMFQWVLQTFFFLQERTLGLLWGTTLSQFFLVFTDIHR